MSNVHAYPALLLEQSPPEGQGLRALSTADAPEWEGLLDWEESFAPGIGAKAQAALFLGQFTFFLVVGLLVEGGAMETVPAPEAIEYRLQSIERQDWAGTVRIRILPDHPSVSWEDLLAPIVEALGIRTGASRGALWRVAGDGIAAGLLDYGRKFGQLTEMQALFRAILKREGSALANPELQWPEDEAGGVLQRGGCCRIYEAGLPLCPGCVLNCRAGTELV